MADTSRTQLRKLKDEYARNPASRVFVHLAEAHRKAGEFRQAQQVLTEGLRRHTDYPSGLVVLAKVLSDQGQEERAAAVWRDVVRLDPEHVVALRALAEIAESAGRRDEALELYRRLIRLENGDPADEPLLASHSFDAEDAAPVASAPAPERRPAAPTSRFSWLVKSLTRAAPGSREPAPPAFIDDDSAAGAIDEPVQEAAARPRRPAELQPLEELPGELAEAQAEPAPAAAAPPQRFVAVPEGAVPNAQPAVRIPDEEAEPAVPIRDSEAEAPPVAEPRDDVRPADPFEGILPVNELNTFEGILGGAELVEVERIVPGDIILSGGAGVDTAPPELGEVEGPDEAAPQDAPDEEIEREDIESQEEIVAAAAFHGEVADGAPFRHEPADTPEETAPAPPAESEQVTNGAGRRRGSRGKRRRRAKDRGAAR